MPSLGSGSLAAQACGEEPSFSTVYGFVVT